jgi:hypothetical protein
MFIPFPFHGKSHIYVLPIEIFNMNSVHFIVIISVAMTHEVMGSSLRNSLLQKCKERLRAGKDPKWSDSSPDPAQAGAMCTGMLPFHLSIPFISNFSFVLGMLAICMRRM